MDGRHITIFMYELNIVDFLFISLRLRDFVVTCNLLTFLGKTLLSCCVERVSVRSGWHQVRKTITEIICQIGVRMSNWIFIKRTVKYARSISV